MQTGYNLVSATFHLTDYCAGPTFKVLTQFNYSEECTPGNSEFIDLHSSQHARIQVSVEALATYYRVAVAHLADASQACTEPECCSAEIPLRVRCFKIWEVCQTRSAKDLSKASLRVEVLVVLLVTCTFASIFQPHQISVPG